MKTFEVIMMCIGSVTAIGVIFQLVTKAIRALILSETSRIRDSNSDQSAKLDVITEVITRIETQTTKTNGRVTKLESASNDVGIKIAIINEHLHLQQ